MIRNIVLWPDPALSTVCTPVGPIDADVRSLASDMLETMYAAPGRGLAAPQVGVLLRLFVMDTSWKDAEPDPVVMVNPEIVAESAERRTGSEGCLSIPGIAAEVERAAEVTMRWTALDGGSREETLVGFDAVCAQHELDHLNGVVTFDRLAPDVRAALEAEYRA